MLEKISLSQVPVTTSDDENGKDYTFLSLSDNAKTGITKIAVTVLRGTEKLATQVSATAEKYLLVRKGSIAIHTAEETIKMVADDFLRIPTQTAYSVEALEDAEILCIGCAIE